MGMVSAVGGAILTLQKDRDNRKLRRFQIGHYLSSHDENDSLECCRNDGSSDTRRMRQPGLGDELDGGQLLGWILDDRAIDDGSRHFDRRHRNDWHRHLELHDHGIE
jgi:hypothetical protein